MTLRGEGGQEQGCGQAAVGLSPHSRVLTEISTRCCLVSLSAICSSEQNADQNPVESLGDRGGHGL